MPAKKKAAAKPAAKKAAKASPKAEVAGVDQPKQQKESDPFVDSLIARRDKLLETADTEEKKLNVHMALKGMYKCAKEKDQPCLDGLSENLKKLGGRPRRRSRSRSKPRSKKH